MCDICADFLDLLQSYEEKVSRESEKRPLLKKYEVEIVYLFIQSWASRQCMCCFRDSKNYERFNLLTQSIIYLAVCKLVELKEEISIAKHSDKNENIKEIEFKKDDDKKSEKEEQDENDNKENKLINEKVDLKKETPEKKEEDDDGEDKEVWTIQEKENLLQFLSKVFLLNFPLYVACKHSGHLKLDELSQEEVSTLSAYCDLHDYEIPVYILRNVCLFCKHGGVHAMTLCFDKQSPDTLPVSVAHAIIGIVCNLKLWLNFRSIMQLFVPLRAKVLKYMCSLADKDFRLAGIKNMADFIWSAVKDPLDSPLTFDRDGLDLAFKYFSSSTLTMRLAGIAQINSHINMFNELCTNESILEVENVGGNLANWLIDNNIISHIFGPNLHVEVIKQSHIILTFLAVENKFTNEHIDIIWQAAQLKHCSKQVHDLLPPLIKNLEAGPVLHLYSLLSKLEPKDHTEQSLYLASSLIKFIWNNGGSYSQLTSAQAAAASAGTLAGMAGAGMVMAMGGAPFIGLGKAAVAASLVGLKQRHRLASSSENSASIEPSDDEQAESSQPSEGHKSSSELSFCPPTKRTRKLKKKHKIIEDDSSEGSVKIEDLDVEEPEEEEEEEEEKDEEEEEEEEEEEHENENEDEIKSPQKNRSKPDAPKFILRKTFCRKGSGCHRGTSSEAEDTDVMSPPPKKKSKCLRKRKKTHCKSLQGKLKLKINNEPRIDCSDDDEPETCSDEDHRKEKSGTPRKVDHSDICFKSLEADQEVPSLLVRDGPPAFIQLLEERSQGGVVGGASSPDSPHGEVMTELASLVQGTDFRDANRRIHECSRPFLNNLQVHREMIEEMHMMSGEEGSYSSRMSNKSEKNMADFDGEESGCEDELVQLAAQAQVQAHLSPHTIPQHLNNIAFHSRFHSAKLSRESAHEVSRIFAHFKMENVCKPGSTLLWDLLQDDKIVQLGEGLAIEAEKALCNLLCFNTERVIRMKFIEGCLENLANNRSVVISLRLLPKLLASFQQFRGMDTHQITTWAECEHHMMRCFFNNLQTYTKHGPKTPLYSHQTEIQVRLQFLTSIFSPVGSPESFRLSLDQVDILWLCLATDPQCSDELFSWLLSQAKSKDQHALGLDALKHLYMRKLPSLEPETISMTCLGLFQQLCNLARLATAHLDKELDVLGMSHLWKIALRANNTDVSMAAIQYLNSYYVGRQLDHELEFVSQCMGHLAAASKDLTNAEESSLLCIQRALLLLKTHLETFRRRYAYHLRRWTLEGLGVASHVPFMSDRGCVPMKVMIQPTGFPEKIPLEMLSTDYIADLRAEVVKCWETIQINKANAQGTSSEEPGPISIEGPIRMIAQGQELTTEFDEKTLQEMGFKDLHTVYVSVGATRHSKCAKHQQEAASALPPPPRESLPTLLLLQPDYFEQLFKLMQTLGSMRTPVKGGNHIPHTKAQVLSRRVWDILTLLPTSPILLRGFQEMATTPNNMKLSQFLDPTSPQKLMYSLYIVESLSRPSKKHRLLCNGGGGDTSEQDGHSWSHMFVQHGGLRHLFDIFMSGVLQRSGSGGSEWQQDCLASLLKLLHQLGIATEDPDPDSSEFFRNKRGRRLRKGSTDKLAVPKLNDTMLKMMKINTVMPRLTSILQEASLPRDPNHYKTGFWGRAQVVHYAMSLLVSWVHSKEEVRQVLFSGNHLMPWLQRLILEDPEPAVRREVCTALYRLCLGTPQAAQTFAGMMLVHLMDYLSVAESMRPPKIEAEDGKEPYGPACRDYFWLLCRLVDSLPSELVKESIEDPTANCLDIDGLAKKIASSILSRDYLETRHNTVEDDGLIGLLNLMSNVIKHGPPFKTSKEGQEFLLQIFEFLFALPNPRKRYVPKCKSQLSRSSAYDLLGDMVKESLENYIILHERLLDQHQPGPHSPYPWDYWPHEDGRSDCGYVGLTNLGATCYMASCMQHLYMMPQARTSILRAKCDSDSKHEHTLRELQRMFAYLLESERKAYNPRSFCKVYTMDHQPLNTGEQKDMAEFFIDLVSKLEEMTPELKKLVKTLFGGVLSNNVVSLDCEHVSRTLEEFYTVRCQVADMRNLYESLDEVTVKDTLEGDNMYTCSQCGKKVRAEKRACFKKLPHILCFNTMRYTFNMVTMLKEKVNTHFSFPLRLDMSGYVEKQLMPHRYQEEKRKSQLRKSEQKEDSSGKDEEISGYSDAAAQMEGRECSDSEDFNERYEYDLIGVTVHTGTADGGHYYSFIRDRTTSNRDKWFLFNDAEVKPFDPNQIAAECFGGEMTSKTYDSVTDKFMDFSFEKTNSAYMLFYEWCSRDGEQRGDLKLGTSEPVFEPIPNGSKASPPVSTSSTPPPPFELSKELEDWIWQDNMHFLRDKNIFEHSYFNFMWQVCGYIPQTLISQHHDITQMAAQLSTSFFMETFIHAKEKPTMVQWVELLTKQFNTSQAACEWFLDHMALNDWWPVQILIKCPNQMVRQMFQRLCIHVIQQLRASHASLYLKGETDEEEQDSEKIGCQSCVTQFVRMLLRLMEHGAKAHLKHLTEYFGFLNEFSKMGEEECQFLISVNAISAMVSFYLGQKSQDYVEVVSEEDEEEDIIPVPTDKYKPASLEKMITLIAVLVEKSRGNEHMLQLSSKDYNSVASGKGLPFLYQQIKDSINLHQTRNLIFTLTRWNERVAFHIVNMILQSMSKQQTDNCQPFFKILTLLTEPANANGPGLPCFSQMVLQNIWEVAEFWPQNALDWLATQVPRNKLAHHWVLQSMDRWVEHYLIAHGNQRVRSTATQLLVSLVPSPQFRNGYRNTRSLTSPQKEMAPGSEAQHMLHQILGILLRLLKAARHYTDIQTHGTSKLTAYFALLTYCTISRSEKLMFGQYFLDLWQLFHPKLSEPSIPFHHNKQALLMYWHHVCVDCPENVQLILQNPHVTKNIAFNYILADHEDQEVVMFNRGMLPAYYGLLRLCCLQSRTFTRQLANHQNLHWAFKNITTYPSQYSAAVDELFKLIRLFLVKFPDSNEQEIHEINTFRRQTIQLYLQVLDGRTSWATLILAFRTLMEVDDDRLYVAYNGGLQMAFEAFHTLHMMHHEASTCQVYGDLLDLLSIIFDMIKSLRALREPKEVRALLMASKEWVEILRKLATLLNTYNPSDMRTLAIDLLKEMLLALPTEVIQVLVPLLSHCHAAFQESHNTIPMGPFFPRPMGLKNNHTTRPARPMVQMAVPHGQLEISKGNDEEYDHALLEFYSPYHDFIDMMCRLAINNDCMSEALINLSAMVGFEGVPLHLTFFAKLWVDIYDFQNTDKKYIAMLTTSNYFVDYAEAVLLDERTSLNTDIIYNFLSLYFPKVASHVLTEQTCNLIDNLVSSLSEIAASVDILQLAYKMNGDLRALSLVYRSDCSLVPPKSLRPALVQLLNKTKETREAHQPPAAPNEQPSTPAASSTDSQVDIETEEAVAETRSSPSGSGVGVGVGETSSTSTAKKTETAPMSLASSGSSTSSSSPNGSKDSDGDEMPSASQIRLQAKERATKARNARAGVRWLEPLEETLAALIALVDSKGS